MEQSLFTFPAVLATDMADKQVKNYLSIQGATILTAELARKISKFDSDDERQKAIHYLQSALKGFKDILNS